MEKTSDEQIMALQNQLQQAKTAYDELKSKINSIESLREQLQLKENEISDLKNSDTREQLLKCQEELQKSKTSYEHIKKKHAEKIQKYNDLEKNYQNSKKDSAYNRQQSENIVKEKTSQIKDLINNINSLNDYKINSVKKKDFEILQEEHNKLKRKYSELLGTYNQKNPQCVNRVENSQKANGNLLYFPSIKWVENPYGQPGGKFKYEPDPNAIEHIREYYPNFNPKEVTTVEQGYYTQSNNKDDSDESGSDHWDGTYFPSQDRNDFYGDADPYD